MPDWDRLLASVAEGYGRGVYAAIGVMVMVVLPATFILLLARRLHGKRGRRERRVSGFMVLFFWALYNAAFLHPTGMLLGALLWLFGLDLQTCSLVSTVVVILAFLPLGLYTSYGWTILYRKIEDAIIPEKLNG